MTLNAPARGKDDPGEKSEFLLPEISNIVEEGVRIPFQSGSFEATAIHLSGTIYMPPFGGKFPLLIMNHGTPKSAEERKRLTKMREQSRIFVRKGFMVLVPMRRGHGDSEGEYAEEIARCSQVDYDFIAKEAVKDIRAAVAFMGKQPYVDPQRKIWMVGQSSGGFAALAYAGMYPAELAAVINFAGGKGPLRPYEVCKPEKLIATVARFGKTSKKLPTLWVYSAKDVFFPPDLSRSMFEAYRKNGGEGEFQLVQSQFGHNLLFMGSRTWEPIVDEFLKKIKF